MATFRMRNNAASDQHLRARFPLQHPEGSALIDNLSIEVDFAPAATTQVLEPSYWQQAEYPIYWAAFDATFPVGRDVIITAEYDLQPRQYEGDLSLDYVLETGAGWFGAIEFARIEVRLPYENCTAICMSYAPSWPAPARVGDLFTWTRWNLNPTRSDNFSITFVSPSLWREILDLETRAANGLATHDEYLLTANLYWSAAMGPGDFLARPWLVELAARTARRGLALRGEPSEFVTSLATYYSSLWHSIVQLVDWEARAPTAFELAEVERIRVALHRALAFDPDNGHALRVLREMETYSWPPPLGP
jgi:hypothetical protein